MENEIMNNEAIEVNDEVTDLTVPETDETAVLDENENSSVGALAIGAGICGLAVVGAIAVGRATYKHVLKPIGGKIKNAFSKGKSAKADTSEATDVEFEDVEENTDTEE